MRMAVSRIIENILRFKLDNLNNSEITVITAVIYMMLMYAELKIRDIPVMSSVSYISALKYDVIPIFIASNIEAVSLSKFWFINLQYLS